MVRFGSGMFRCAPCDGGCVPCSKYISSAGRGDGAAIHDAFLELNRQPACCGCREEENYDR